MLCSIQSADYSEQRTYEVKAESQQAAYCVLQVCNKTAPFTAQGMTLIYVHFVKHHCQKRGQKFFGGYLACEIVDSRLGQRGGVVG